MGRNDHYVDPLGRVRSGSLTMGREAIHALQDELGEMLYDIHIKESPMLKGEGFIVVDPKNPRFSGREHSTLDEAQEEANDIAYSSGKAIIYAPALILKPDRPVIAAKPTALLESALNRPNALPPGEVKPASSE